MGPIIADRTSVETRRFAGAGLTLVADIAGDPAAQPVLFLHGGGQTRASWGNALRSVAAEGFRAVALDLRGHGESEWAPDGDYELPRFAADLRQVLSVIDRPAFLVGASLGGLTSLLLAGDANPPPLAGLVLVDVVPHIERAGAEKIVGFMRASPNGFASVDEAADAVSAYLPHRPRPKDTSGLARNLRLGADGRYRWHWDPLYMASDRPPNPVLYREELDAAASRLRIPTLLIRGALSQLVSPEGVRDFLKIVPQAEFVDVSGADHMVAGDKNDAFNDATLSFLKRHAL